MLKKSQKKVNLKTKLLNAHLVQLLIVTIKESI